MGIIFLLSLILIQDFSTLITLNLEVRPQSKPEIDECIFTSDAKWKHCKAILVLNHSDWSSKRFQQI